MRWLSLATRVSEGAFAEPWGGYVRSGQDVGTL